MPATEERMQRFKELRLQALPPHVIQPGKTTVLSPEDEASFQQQYGEIAQRIGINPNPDDPRHEYDYRGAFAAGQLEPGPDNHFSSQFKTPNHPNRFVQGAGGVQDTITGEVKQDPRLQRFLELRKSAPQTFENTPDSTTTVTPAQPTGTSTDIPTTTTTAPPLIRPEFLADKARYGVGAFATFPMQATALLLEGTDALIEGALTMAGLDDLRDNQAPFGSQELTSTVNRINPPSIKALNNWEHVAGTVVELLANQAVPTATTITLAKRFAQLSPNNLNALQAAVAKIATRPWTEVVAMEALLAGGAGAVGGAVGVATDSETAETVAILVSVMGLPATVTTLSALGTRLKSRTLLKVMTQTDANMIAGRTLNDAGGSDPMFREILNRTGQAYRETGLSKYNEPDIGAQSRDPGLARLAAQERAKLSLGSDEVARSSRFDAELRGKLAEAPGVPTAGAGGADDIRTRAIQGRADIAGEQASRVADAEYAATQARKFKADEFARDKLRAQTATNNLDDALDQHVTAAKARIDAAARDADPDVALHVSGRRIIDEFDNEADLFRQRVDPAYNRLAEQSEGVVAEVGNINKIAQGHAQASEANPGGVDPIRGGKTTPDVSTRLLADEEWQQGTVSFKRLNELRGSIMDERAEIKAGLSPNQKKLKNLAELQDEVEVIIDQLGESGQIDGLRAVNQFVREGKARLAQGRAAEVQRAGRRREETLTDLSGVVSKFLQADGKGAQEGIDSYVKAFSGQPGRAAEGAFPGIDEIPTNTQALAALDDAIVSEAVRVNVHPITGEVEADRLLKWMNRHKTALGLRPDAAKRLATPQKVALAGKQELADLKARQKFYQREVINARQRPTAGDDRVAAAKAGLDDARQQEAAALQEFDKSALGLALPGKDIAKLGGEVLDSGPEAAKALVKSLSAGGDARALAGLKRVVWQEGMARMRGGGGRSLVDHEPLLSEDQIRRFIERNGETLGVLYKDNQAQIEYLRLVADAAGSNEAAINALGKSNLSEEILGKSAKFLSPLLSRYYNFQRGIIGAPYLITEGIGRVINSQVGRLNSQLMRKTLNEALMDGDKAELLMDLARATGKQASAKRFRGLVIVPSSKELDRLERRTRQPDRPPVSLKPGEVRF